MFDFLRSPKPDEAAERILRLLEEQNLLLRELLYAVNPQAPARVPRTVKMPLKAERRVYTGDDVIRMTRAEYDKQAEAERTKTAAPWRNGQEMPQTSLGGGMPQSETVTVTSPST
jgi:hypothetical protein